MALHRAQPVVAIVSNGHHVGHHCAVSWIGILDGGVNSGICKELVGCGSIGHSGRGANGALYCATRVSCWSTGCGGCETSMTAYKSPKEGGEASYSARGSFSTSSSNKGVKSVRGRGWNSSLSCRPALDEAASDQSISGHGKWRDFAMLAARDSWRPCCGVSFTN